MQSLTFITFIVSEELLGEEQASFRPERSTVEQIFNSQFITEKHLQHQCNLFNSFTDFKKACDSVWHVSLRKVLRSFNMHEGLVQAIQALYENTSSAVLLNSQLGEIFKTKVSVPSGMLPVPILFNLFLEKIMQETLHDHHTSISTGGRPICNIQHWSYERQQLWSSRPHQQICRQSKGIWNGGHHKKDKDYDQ